MEDISIYKIHNKYKPIIDMIKNSTIRRIYSKYSFSYLSTFKKKSTNNNSNSKKNQNNHTLSKYFNNCQFITFQCHINNINTGKSLNCDKHNDALKANIIFCFESLKTDHEGKCLIIDDIEYSLIQTIIEEIKRKEIALIDCCANSENPLINEETDSFCSHFLHVNTSKQIC